MSLPRLPFSKGRPLGPFAEMLSEFFHDEQEMGPQETTSKNEILLYGHQRMPSKHVLNGHF
jgi:hypothetical protein